MDRTQIVQLIQTEQWSEALRALKTCCESAPQTLWAWQLTAQLAVQLKLWALAEQALQQMIRLQPGQSEAYFNLSQLFLLQGQSERAERVYLQAVQQLAELNELRPALQQYLRSQMPQISSPSHQSLRNLAWLFAQRFWQQERDLGLELLNALVQPEDGDHDTYLLMALELRALLLLQRANPEAVCLDLQRLIALAPSAERWHKLGVAQVKAGDVAAAEESLRQALALKSDFRPAQEELAKILVLQTRYAEALEYLASPLSKALGELLIPAAEDLLNRGKYLLAYRYLELCETVVEQVSFPKGSFYLLWAACAHRLVRAREMETFLNRAQAAGIPEVEVEQQRLISLPYAYRSRAEAEQVDQGFDFRLQKFKRKAEKAFASGQVLLAHFQPQPPFILSYLRRNMLPIMQELSGFWHDLYVRHGLKLTCAHEPGQHEKVRIAFISRYFYHHSVLECYGQMIAGLAGQANLEVLCLQLGHKQDSKTLALKAEVDQFLNFDEAEDIPSKILELKLDVLIYTDIGMDPLTYRLGLHRLAPIQMVLLGHPVTTGLPEIDYVLVGERGSLSDLEPEFTERMMSLVGHSTKQSPPVLSQAALTRTELGLEEKAHIYFCPMTLYKIHPAFDALMAGILEKDPQGQIYLARYHESPYHEVIQERFATAYPPLADRLHFVPWMEQQRFYAMILASDVVLDSIYFGGGTTIRMVLGLERPFLTLPGRYIRESIALRLYQKNGLAELAAQSPEDYVDKAVRLASDPTYRQAWLAQVADKLPQIFEVSEGIQDLGNKLRALVAQYPERTLPEQLEL